MLFLIQISYSQYLLDTLFNVNLIKNVLYSSDTNYQGDSVYLTFDGYIPVNEKPENPTLIFLHGGGFVLGSKDSRVAKAVCNRFAQLGYTTISANYRLGYGNIESKSIESKKTLFRTFEDVSKLIDFLSNDRRLKVDVNTLILGGSSAGAIIALHYVLSDSVLIQKNFNQSTSLPQYGFKAIVAMCGALGGEDWLLSKPLVPIVSVHGDNDKFVPYNKGVSNPPKVMGFGKIPSDTLFGSGIIKVYSDSIGRTHFHKVFMDQPHIPYDGIVHPGMYKSYLDTSLSFIRYNLYNILFNQSLAISYSVESSQLNFVRLENKTIRVNIPDQNIKSLSAKVLNREGGVISKLTFKKIAVYFFSKQIIPSEAHQILFSFKSEEFLVNLKNNN